MNNHSYQLGIVGLGVMGRNLVLNMADHHFPVAGYDKDPKMVQTLQTEAEGRTIRGTGSLEEFISLLSRPRAIMMLVPAGPPVDALIRDLLPHLEKGDLIIDGGNSYFEDTDLRARTLAERGIHFLGVGVSGGEDGARHGPSLMPGGAVSAYARIEPIFESIAARVDGEPCVAYLGPGAAGHYVKMVHNGIEYGLMQLIAETYDLLKRGLGLSDDQLHGVYEDWNQGDLQSFLVEITAHIFRQVDETAGRHLIDVILDEARQKGTGMWTAQNAMELHVPLPTTNLAVTMRDMSGLKEERGAASRFLTGPAHAYEGHKPLFIAKLRGALHAAMIITYAQGMALLQQASDVYGFNLDLETVARIWRGGCIIRSALLEDIRAAYRRRSAPANLLVDPRLGKAVMDRQEDLRDVVHVAVDLGLPTTAFMASLAYFDAYRSGWLPANLIQAQRDYFGAHTYERNDTRGVFHIQWSQV